MAAKRTKKPPSITLQRQREAATRLNQVLGPLRERVADIKAHCAPLAVGSVFERFRSDFGTTARQLQYDPAVADQLLAEPKREKRLKNFAKAECRMAARRERIEAEPKVLAARGAKKAHRGARKEELRGEREARALKKRTQASAKDAFQQEVDQGVAELQSDEKLAPLAATFRKMAPQLKRRKGGGTLLEKFVEWAGEHDEEVQAIVANAGAVPSSKLAASQRRHEARKAAKAPGSGPRSSRRGGRASQRSGRPSQRGASASA
jgi:hypothetical protein